jgi:hypothetical protein
MKMKRIFLTIILSTIFVRAFACSCGSMKITNTYSILDFIGIVEFKNLTELKNSYGIYKTTFELKELFKGKVNEKIFVDSMKGSSCSFIPEKNRKYLIFGYKNKDGKIMTSFCLAQGNPDKKSLSILRYLKKKKIGNEISSNLRQTLRNKINSNLFEKSVNGIFLYKVVLDSNLKFKEILPNNKNAQRNFSEKIKKELEAKISYELNEKDKGIKNEKFISYIILTWEKNYENERIITTTRL